MEYGFSIAGIEKSWVLKLFKNGEVNSCQHYKFKDDLGRVKAYEEAMLDGHIYVTTHVYMIPFAGYSDPLLDQAISQLQKFDQWNTNENPI